jgi:hypothetical protein
MAMTALFSKLAVATLVLCISHIVCNINTKPEPEPREKLLSRRASINVETPVSYIYVVGIEGVGHHGVTPALAVIAKSCGHHVEYQPRFLRHMQSRGLPGFYSTFLSHITTLGKDRTLGADKVSVIEDQSFPMDYLKRNSTMEEKKSALKYNVEWLYNEIALTGTSIRFLHLTRDFYRTVASHADFDGGFVNHALILKSFQEYIRSEFERIEVREPGLWRQIHYEWFAELRNCTALASAVIDFAGWDNCDVDFACEVLHKTLRNSTKRSINETDYAFAQSLNASIPIPDLDISDSREYNFTHVISARDIGHYSGELRSGKGLSYRPTRNASVARRQRKAPSPSHSEGSEAATAAGVVVTSNVGHGANLQRTSRQRIPANGQRTHKGGA